MSPADQPVPNAAVGVDDQQAIGQQQPAKVGSNEKHERQAVKDYSRTEANGQLSMRVKVYSPFHDYYDDQAFSVSAVNDTGPFDVLPRHHNFISLLNPCEVVIRRVDNGEQRIRISGGIIHVKADRLSIFLDV